MARLQRKRECHVHGIRVLVYKNTSDLFKDAANELFETLRKKPDANIGLATGATFLPFYKYVSSKYKIARASFSKVNTFNLDEYVGLGRNDPNSYFTYMRTNLFSKIDIDQENANVPDGSSKDPKAEASGYERKIARLGGIDLQYLGIGQNGHIGFNEPGTPFGSKTHVVRLCASTIRQNSKYFGNGKMPRSAITMGIKTINSANKIVVIAVGKAKASIVKKALTCKPNKKIPASSLKRNANVTFMLDNKSASLLK